MFTEELIYLILYDEYTYIHPGGSFALYSLLCRHAKFSLLPNQQAADEELSSYKYGFSGRSTAGFQLKRFLEKHKKSRTVLLVIVLLAACMVIGDGVLTPAMSGRNYYNNYYCLILCGIRLCNYVIYKLEFVSTSWFLTHGAILDSKLGVWTKCLWGPLYA